MFPCGCGGIATANNLRVQRGNMLRGRKVKVCSVQWAHRLPPCHQSCECIIQELCIAGNMAR
eukprot:6135662-Amphidinium_carterae.1